MSTQTKVAYTVTNDRISIVIDGRYRSFLRASKQGKDLEVAVKKTPQDLDEIRLLADVAAYVAAKSFGRVILDDKDRIRLDGHVVDYIAAGTFKRVLEEGFDIQPLVKFIENVALNPDKSVAGDLYAFLEKGRLPITEDGCFHAFKRVRDDYKDHHSGTVDYQLDTTVSMPRENCDPNRSQTCSRGLHACSFEYLSQFHGGRGRILIVKINPQNVTAIPTDYNQAKLRCCEMYVLGEIPEDDARQHFTSAVDRRYQAEPDAVDPEDATDAGAEDGVTTTAGETSAEPTVTVGDGVTVTVGGDADAAIDWSKRGYDAGKKAGHDDGTNEYDYDVTFDMPSELADGPDSARQAYSEAYIRGYSEGFAEGRIDQQDEQREREDAENEAEGDLDAGAIDDGTPPEPTHDDNGVPFDVEAAKTLVEAWGKEDAEKFVEGKNDREILSAVGDDGERYRIVYESDASHDDADVDDAYLKGWLSVLKPLWDEIVPRVAEADALAQAASDTTFDADVDYGSHSSEVFTLEDENGEGPWDLIYRQTYTRVYASNFKGA